MKAIVPTTMEVQMDGSPLAATSVEVTMDESSLVATATAEVETKALVATTTAASATVGADALASTTPVSYTNRSRNFYRTEQVTINPYPILQHANLSSCCS